MITHKMKKYFISASVLLVLSGTLYPAHAITGVTLGKHAACFSKTQLEELLSYVASNDFEAYKQMIYSGECISLKSGVEVDVETHGILGTIVTIRLKGQRVKLWTVREEVEILE